MLRRSTASDVPPRLLGIGEVSWTSVDAIAHRGTAAINGPDDEDAVLVTALRDTAHGRAVRQRLTANAEILRTLRHPQVAEVVHLHLQPLPWVAVRQPEGCPLFERLANEPIPSPRALTWAADWCRALEALEAHHLGHISLDAHRVWVTDERSWVVEVGTTWPGIPDDIVDDHVCRAPEQVLGLTADHRADLHAVGVLLLRLLTGTWPATVTDRTSLESWARADVPETLVAQLPPTTAAVVRRALARRPGERYPSATPLREDIERLLHGFSPLHARPVATRTLRAPGTATVDQRPSTMSRRTPTITPPAPRPRPRLLPGLAALSGISAAAVGAWWFLHTATPSTASVSAATASATAPTSPTIRGPAGASATGQDPHGPWAEVVVGTLRCRLRQIPAGTCWIGSPADEAGHQENEVRFLARLSRSTWMLDREVDQRLYAGVTGTNPSYFRGDDLPVDNVTWDEATLFCHHLTTLVPGLRARLPTEVEWEMACRAGGHGPRGNEGIWDAMRSGRVSHPVATLPANAWGFYDLQGNVMEWTLDALAPYPRESTADRHIPTGALRVVRGGAWCSTPDDCRSARRSGSMTKAHLSYLGFRIVLDEAE